MQWGSVFPGELAEKYHPPHGIIERTKWMQDPWVKAWRADSHCCLPPRRQLPLPRLLVPLSFPLKFSFMLCSSSCFRWPLPHLCAHRPFQGSRGTHHFAHVSSCWCGLAGILSTFSVLLGFFLPERHWPLKYHPWGLRSFLCHHLLTATNNACVFLSLAKSLGRNSGWWQEEGQLFQSSHSEMLSWKATH